MPYKSYVLLWLKDTGIGFNAIPQNLKPSTPDVEVELTFISQRVEIALNQTEDAFNA